MFNFIEHFLQLIGQHFMNTPMSEIVSKKSRQRETRKSRGGVVEKDVKQSALKAMLDLIINQSTPGYLQYKMLFVFSQLNNKVGKLLLTVRLLCI